VCLLLFLDFLLSLLERATIFINLGSKLAILFVEVPYMLGRIVVGYGDRFLVEGVFGDGSEGMIEDFSIDVLARLNAGVEVTVLLGSSP
jgi:hypothetical protein